MLITSRIGDNNFINSLMMFFYVYHFIPTVVHAILSNYANDHWFGSFTFHQSVPNHRLARLEPKQSQTE